MENNIHIVRFKDGTDVICEMEELDSFQIKITNPMMFAVRSSNLILQQDRKSVV